MSILMKLFGESFRVRFEGVDVENRKFTGTCPIRVLNLSWDEIESRLKDSLFVEHNIESKELKIIASVKVEGWRD